MIEAFAALLISMFATLCIMPFVLRMLFWTGIQLLLLPRIFPFAIVAVYLMIVTIIIKLAYLICSP